MVFSTTAQKQEAFPVFNYGAELQKNYNSKVMAPNLLWTYL